MGLHRYSTLTRSKSNLILPAASASFKTSSVQFKMSKRKNPDEANPNKEYCEFLMGEHLEYCISSVIRCRYFFFPKNLKNLDSSYKMGLDLLDCLGLVKLIL